MSTKLIDDDEFGFPEDTSPIFLLTEADYAGMSDAELIETRDRLAAWHDANPQAAIGGWPEEIAAELKARGLIPGKPC
jgi:hypothetical protein